MSTTIILPDEAQTLPGLFRQRIQRTPDKIAYRNFDIASKEWQDTTWSEMGTEVARWQQAMKREGLTTGDKVAIMLKNSREWVVFDQAAMGLGLITVPLYPDDRPDNVAYIINNAEVSMLVVEGRRQWQRLQEVSDELAGLQRIVSIQTIEEEDAPNEARLKSLGDWIFGVEGELIAEDGKPDELATIVYTSGTTGPPKGVMLSHSNILASAYASYTSGDFSDEERFLSFLPLSHMLERTGGYYFPIMIGAEVVYARSILQLADDLQHQQPTVLVSVPRIYEKVHARIQDNLAKESPLKQKIFNLAIDVGWQQYQHLQHRVNWHPKQLLWPLLKKLVADKITAKLGGRLKYAICGGAAMPPDIARVFLSVGVPVYQGYGLTESSPVICVNRPEDNIPESIGKAVHSVEVKIGENSELLARGPNIMLGYWKNDEATRESIDNQGWLHTGDQARVDAGGHYFITGRIKDIIVLGNGEKVPPVDMEIAISQDPLIDQVMIVGEGKAFLSALIVLDVAAWQILAKELDVDVDVPATLQERFVEKTVLARINNQLHSFPGYARIRRAYLTLEPWTVDNGLLTPTLKMKRQLLMRQFENEIANAYKDIK